MDLDYQKSISLVTERGTFITFISTIFEQDYRRHKFESNIKLHIQFILLPLLQVPSILKS